MKRSLIFILLFYLAMVISGVLLVWGSGFRFPEDGGGFGGGIGSVSFGVSEALPETVIAAVLVLAFLAGRKLLIRYLNSR